MKTVLITGSSKGLGKELNKVFLNNGYNVIVCYNTSEDDALNLAKSSNVKLLKLDITKEDEIINLFKNNKIDILINNASISMDNSIEEKTKEEFMNVLEVNLIGTFLMCKYAVKNGVKDIINISSTDSVDTYQSLNIDYSCSKAGIDMLTKTFALSYPSVRIISILPNWIDTESVLSMDREYLKNELNRIGQKELLKKELVAKKIYDIFADKNIKSGSLIRIDEGDINV